MAMILVVDDDPIFREIMVEMLSGMGYYCIDAETLAKGMDAAKNNHVDLVFLDVCLPDGDGLSEMEYFQKVPSLPELIIITGQGDSEAAEMAIKNGAWDYIGKDINTNAIHLTIQRALQYRNKKIQIMNMDFTRRDAIIGNSTKIKACLQDMMRAASGNSSILITGETGTGKELFAKAIHNNSARFSSRFVIVDCTSIPSTLAESLLFGHTKGTFTHATENKDGLVRQAHGGSLFLDEIGDLQLPVQKSLLRVLQDKTYRPLGSKKEEKSDFRLIAATNRNLEEMVQSRRFRKDLFFRISAIHISLPPLRERREDILLLADFYIGKICGEFKVEKKETSKEFLDSLMQYEWPGNVRELVNVLHFSLSSASQEDILYTHHLPTDIRAKLTARHFKDKQQLPQRESQSLQDSVHPDLHLTPTEPIPTLKEFRETVVGRMEQLYLKHLAKASRGVVKKACGYAGLSRARLYELLKKHDMQLK